MTHPDERQSLALSEFYSWDRFSVLFDGWISRSSIFVPIIGYMILFNDFVAEYFTFKLITSQNEGLFMLDQGLRLRLAYFGMIGLGISSLAYFALRPWALTYGTTENEFKNNAFERFSVNDYLLCKEIALKNNDPSFVDRPFDEIWDQFARAVEEYVNQNKKDQSMRQWVNVRNQYNVFLMSLLEHVFYIETRRRLFFLTICIFLSSFGYAILGLISLDLFQAVFRSTFLVGSGLETGM